MRSLKTILLLNFILMSCSCVTHYRQEILSNFDNGIESGNRIPNLDYRVELLPSQVNAQKTKISGPWYFSFIAYDTQNTYKQITIKSITYYESKDNKKSLITDDKPVELFFSQTDRPYSISSVFYHSRDQSFLDLKFHADLKVTLEINFILTDRSNTRLMHTEKFNFKAKIIDRIGSYNPFFVYLEEDRANGLKEVVTPSPYDFRVKQPPHRPDSKRHS